MSRPNVLLILTDQQRSAPEYESEELREFRHTECAGQERLRADGIEFRSHYVMAAACAPSRASLLTGQYPSLHGVTQTDGVAKSADGGEMFWLAPDSVPTLGDWFRAGGYRTYYKGKWHLSHAHIENDEGDEELGIKYEGETTLHVPIDQSHLVARYVGIGGGKPRLNKLGDKRWVAYPHPQVIFQYYDGRTGELDYAEAISVDR